jgi:hypothetical protein
MNDKAELTTESAQRGQFRGGDKSAAHLVDKNSAN